MAFVCLKKDCHKEFKTASGRSKHHKKCSKESIEKQYRVISGSYHCKRCDNQFKHVESWYRHYKIAHRVEERKIKVKDKVIHKCTICSKAFGKKYGLLRHEIIHKKENNFCEACGKSFKRQDFFALHVKKCSSVNMPVQCDMNNDINVNSDNNITFDNITITEVVTEELLHAYNIQTNENYNNSNENILRSVENTCGTSSSKDNYSKLTDESTRKSRKRKTDKLSKVLIKIMDTNLEPGDKAKILRKSMDKSLSKTTLDALMLPVESENLYEAKLVSSVLDYLKTINLKYKDNKKNISLTF